MSLIYDNIGAFAQYTAMQFVQWNFWKKFLAINCELEGAIP
jgi:hypothetical protein